jgi:Carbohydrate family 9 binding domain-like
MERGPSEHAILNMKATSHTFRILGQLATITVMLLSIRPSFGQGISTGKISDPVAPTGPWKRENFSVPKTTTPPVIDGKLDDSCWKTAFHARGFFRWQRSDPTPEQSELWICADEKNLYFAVHCQDSHPELIRAEQTQREGNVNNEDTVTIFLDTLVNRRGVSQFTISAGGVQVTQMEGGAADNHKYAGDWRGKGWARIAFSKSVRMPGRDA